MTKPLGKRVFVRRVDEDKKSSSIIIPDVVKQRQSGIVVALGTGAPKFQFTVKVGDKIVIPPHEHYVISEHEVDGEILALMREEDILAVLEEAA